MRNLTIQRAKCFVGCAAKVKIYIESTQPETTINGVPVQLLGTLKNGEEQSFFIPEEPVRVFAAFDSLTRNYCNDFVPLPAGSEPVFLSGRPHFSLASGNAFRFDNVTDPAVLAARKQNKRSGAGVLGIVFAVGIAAGIAFSGVKALVKFAAQPKPERPASSAQEASSSAQSTEPVDAAPQPATFEADGLTLTLTDAFEKQDAAQFTLCYATDRVLVLALRDAFADTEGLSDYTLADYAELVRQNTCDDSVPLEQDGTLPYFEYEYTDDGGTAYDYFTALYQGTDAFWIVQFVATADDYDAFRPQFVEWAHAAAVK